MRENKVELRRKIIGLFNYRFLPGILNTVEKDETVSSRFINQLITIQEAIYLLDHVLESEWNIINTRLRGKWEAIFSALRDIGLPEENLDEYCRHIYKYQKHELEQRKGKSLLRLSMEYFYFYKSCDVKLLRRLIYDRYPTLKSLMPLADWRWFDLVTEVNDDVLDVYEDINTNNGNRFLLTIKKYNLDYAYQEFYDFLKEIEEAFYLKIRKKEIHPAIMELTFRELKKTMELLDLRRSELTAKPIAVTTIDSI